MRLSSQPDALKEFTVRTLFRLSVQIRGLYMVDFSEGTAYSAPSGGTMLGGEMVNVTGPCFLPTSQIRCKFGQYETLGIYLNPVQAKCVTPMMFEAGWREFGVSVDGGRTYNFRGEFFVGKLTEPLKRAVSASQFLGEQLPYRLSTNLRHHFPKIFGLWWISRDEELIACARQSSFFMWLFSNMQNSVRPIKCNWRGHSK